MDSENNWTMWIVLASIIMIVYSFFSEGDSRKNENISSYDSVRSYNYEGGRYNRSNTYKGYDCTDDCSGHEAGYNWAENNDIYDESDCGGNSNSFIEGCMSYVEENY